MMMMMMMMTPGTSFAAGCGGMRPLCPPLQCKQLMMKMVMMMMMKLGTAFAAACGGTRPQCPFCSAHKHIVMMIMMMMAMTVVMMRRRRWRMSLMMLGRTSTAGCGWICPLCPPLQCTQTHDNEGDDDDSNDNDDEEEEDVTDETWYSICCWMRWNVLPVSLSVVHIYRQLMMMMMVMM